MNADDKDTLVREQKALNAGIEELGIDGEILTLDSYLRDGIKIY